MARNDGIDRTSARNVNLTAAKIGNAQRHNEREKESYTNPDIIPERTPQNIHFKKPTAEYAEMFAQMEKDGVISTRGLQSDANLYGELIQPVEKPLGVRGPQPPEAIIGFGGVYGKSAKSLA